jgi:hypothetical protein
MLTSYRDFIGDYGKILKEIYHGNNHTNKLENEELIKYFIVVMI